MQPDDGAMLHGREEAAAGRKLDPDRNADWAADAAVGLPGVGPLADEVVLGQGCAEARFFFGRSQEFRGEYSVVVVVCFARAMLK